MNKVLYVPAGVALQQIEGFPADCKRERKGALHVRPSSTLVVSEDELAYLKEKHPQLLARLQDITPPVAPPPEPPVTVVPGSDESESDAKPSFRRGKRAKEIGDE